MGGCLTDPKPRQKPTQSIIKPILKQKPEQSLNKQELQVKNISIKGDSMKIQQKPKYRKINSLQILSTYRIQSTLENSTRMQGPKYISNYVDGSCKVLRVYNGADVDQQRLQAHSKLLNLQVCEDQEGNFIIFDQYCAGPGLTEFMLKSEGESYQVEARKVLEQIYDIIDSFHKQKVWLGCLNIDSFKLVSQYSTQVRLVEFNITDESTTDSMGFAHKEGYEADWEFYGYLLKYFTSNWTPVFIPHKMQYSSNDQQLIADLLKAKQVSRSKLKESQLKFIVAPKPIIYGYKFRKDINKLMKIRRKRKAHNKKYYDQQMQENLGGRPLQQAAYRMETERVMKRIKQYIQNLDNNCQEPFMMYSNGGEKLKKLKEVFLIKDSEQKMDQLRETLSSIR